MRQIVGRHTLWSPTNRHGAVLGELEIDKDRGIVDLDLSGFARDRRLQWQREMKNEGRVLVFEPIVDRPENFSFLPSARAKVK